MRVHIGTNTPAGGFFGHHARLPLNTGSGQNSSFKSFLPQESFP
jgi:hypothetical protein